MPICKCGFKYPAESTSCPLCGSKSKQPRKGIGLPNDGGDRGLQRKSRIKKSGRPAPIGKGKRRRLKNGGSETAVFIEIWRERRHVCQNLGCGAELKTFKPICFHHLKTKGAHPALRLVKRNIALLCENCHTEAHRKGNRVLTLPEYFKEFLV